MYGGLVATLKGYKAMSEKALKKATKKKQGKKIARAKSAIKLLASHIAIWDAKNRKDSKI